MYRGNKEKSYHNHWFEWCSEYEKEQLFRNIHDLVYDMIREIVPQEVEKYLNSTSIVANVVNKDDLHEQIIRQVQKSLN